MSALRLAKLRQLRDLRRRRDELLASDPSGERRRLIEQCPTALDLAARFDPQTVRTPALELLADRLRIATLEPGGRLVVSIAPQEGKSTLLRWLCAWLLADDPDRRLVFASFAHSLARSSGRQIRDIIRTHPELALALDGSHADASDWQIAGARGGLYAVGTGGALTGRPADVLLVDDPLRNQQDADSPVVRERLHEWWTSVARTRLAPGAPVVVVQTRWHEDDLAGRLVGEGWPLVNIPALADGDTADALARPAGEWLVSARGRTRVEWEQTRRDVGERVFAALYQGRPAPLAGGIFEQAWIDAHRVQVAPDELVATCVAVDPADTGLGDAAGILVGSRAADGTIYVRADASGQLSQGEWARRLCLHALWWDADTILQESNLGMGRAIRDAWSVILRQARALAAAPRNGHGADDAIRGALAALDAAGDAPAADEGQLRELEPHVDDVLSRPSTGPSRVVAVTPRQSKFVRAHAVTGLYETGRARHVGRLPLLEHEMVTWQPGQKSPNRLDTLAHLLTHLDVARHPTTVGSPTGGGKVPLSTTGARRRGGAVPMVTAHRGLRR